jgi:DNA-binding response OmpR family regulator
MDEDKKKEKNTEYVDTTPQKPTVLIVEDDSVLKNMYMQKLKSDGYDVYGAADGTDGLAVFEKEKIDLILTDIMLPKMSGTEFLAKIRKTKKGKDLPVIAWTNLHDEDVENKVRDLGVKEFLMKGEISLDQVSEVVKKYL